MTKFKDIVQDCINGCTSRNINEMLMHFNINYYVNDTFGHGEKYQMFVFHIDDLEKSLREIISNNIIKGDVVIGHITIKDNDEVIRVNNNNYPYSIKDFINTL